MPEITRRMKFSERMGIVEPRTVIQIDEMDDDLRTTIYNCIYKLFDVCWNQASGYGKTGMGEQLAYYFWTVFLKEPIDQMPLQRWAFEQEFKEIFFEFEWYEVYDCIEFIVQDLEDISDPTTYAGLTEYLNSLLAEGLSGYQFVNGKLVPVSNAVELESLTTSLEIGDKYAGARQHISAALELLANRGQKDYRNVIKEAISAVESAAQVIVNDKSMTLGKALKELEKKGYIHHPALKDAWEKLYGYASDADGIRHALTSGDEPVSLGLARYMLISCSAFVNYLTSLESGGK